MKTKENVCLVRGQSTFQMPHGSKHHHRDMKPKFHKSYTLPPISCLGRQTHCLPWLHAEATSAVFYRHEKECFWRKELLVPWVPKPWVQNVPRKENSTSWKCNRITLYHELQLFRLLYKDDRVVLIPRNCSFRDIKDSRQQQLRYCCIHKAYTAGGRQAAIFSWFQKPFQSCTSEGPLLSDLLTARVPFQAGV